MTPRRYWVLTGNAGVILWLVLSPSWTLPGLRQGLLEAIGGTFGIAGILALADGPFLGSDPNKKAAESGEEGLNG